MIKRLIDSRETNWLSDRFLSSKQDGQQDEVLKKDSRLWFRRQVYLRGCDVNFLLSGVCDSVDKAQIDFTIY